jgi:hypothetical protein
MGFLELVGARVSWSSLQVLSDGFAVGGVMPIQQVQEGPSECLSTAEYNETSPLFAFNVTGSTAECESTFRISWDGLPSQGPYNFSVVPLDGGYTPWEVPLEFNNTDGYMDWKVNMTQGTIFTIIMK